MPENTRHNAAILGLFIFPQTESKNILERLTNEESNIFNVRF